MHALLCLEIMQCMDLPALQKTPASSTGTQSWTLNPLCWHWLRFASFPLQLTLSKTIKPTPGPKWGNCVAVAPDVEIGRNKEFTCKSIHTYSYGSHVQTSFMELTDCTVAQLSAHHGCIIIVPNVITHCTPYPPVAELHTTILFWYTINQSHCSISTFWMALRPLNNT